MDKAKVLLVNPWIVDFAAYDFWIKPLGLLRIGAILRQRGYGIQLLDCMDRNYPLLLNELKIPHAESRSDGTGRFIKTFLPKPQILKNIPRRLGRYGLPIELAERALSHLEKPDVILVTSGMTYWYPGVFEMIALLRSRFPGVPVILGGVYASLCTDHARRHSGADEVVVGPGEVVALRIVDELVGRSTDAPDGNPDAFPFPLYDLYDRLDSAAIMTSRGCPYRCPFCASDRLAGPYRGREPRHVTDEIESLRRLHGVKEFAFYDDALLFRKEQHIIPILEEVCARGLDVHFHTPNGLQPKAIDADLAALMHRSGFKTIQLSYESRDPDLQRRMSSKVSDSDLTAAVDALKRAGFTGREMGAYVLMGLPDQSASEIIESLLFVLEQGMKVSLTSFTPIPGTQSWREAVDAGRIGADDDPLLGNNSIFPLRSEEIPFDTFIRLGTLARRANRLIDAGGSPLEDRAFRRALEGV